MTAATPSPVTGRPLRLFLSAGEVSGDLHGARLIEAIRALAPDTEFSGYGGERMAAAGQKIHHDLTQELAIIGVSAVVRNLSKVKALLRETAARLAVDRPDAVIAIDYPGFNLRVARAAKALGIPVIYFIAPQIWAWHYSRIEIIRECVRRVLVILPFEAAIYEKERVPVTYVGHPLTDAPPPSVARNEFRQKLGVPDSARLIGLIPGSRKPEILRHLGVMLDAADILGRTHSDLHYVIPRADTVSRELLESAVSRHPGLRVHVTEDQASARGAMDFAFCKSGTSTLELALANVPMVIVYKVSFLSWLIAKFVIEIKWIGLVNIVAQRDVAPEVLQWDLTPAALAIAADRYLSDRSLMAQQRTELAQVRVSLGGPGAPQRAAEAILAELRTTA